ncbi:nucleoside deaminase [Saxibacter everestensis]|uniref:Nucleoside deaminase n=1 Tax=Saxibacter everestensis TaxID=2909229 RepID=A0ABY8QVH0_9MICO|nr:nucleoside deaminase [Brevibacteriaceae bacterium ZFBP1038]
MSRTEAEIAGLMADAVEFSLHHVEAGGLPFIGVLVGDDGYVSDFGVNEVARTGDPTAHAEIVAMRTAMHDLGRSDLEGSWLLATGEPCGLCYSFALDHRADRIYVAVDGDAVTGQGFDYGGSYAAFGIDRAQLAGIIHRIPVARGLAPFERYLDLRHRGISTRPPSSTHPKGTS